MEKYNNTYRSYEEELRETVRKDYHSEHGREQLKHLNPSLRSMIEDFKNGKDVKRLDLFDNWTRPATEHWEIDLQTYFHDEYLKEIGLYEIATEARKENESDLEVEIALEDERDRLNFKERYEDKKSEARRYCLNPKFHRAIRKYIYNNGECPQLMDCFDAPMEVLRNYGIIEDILNERAIREEKAYHDLLKIAEELR
jgi:hypothetical protein